YSFHTLTSLPSVYFFFFNYTAPPEIYTLSLHDALPIWEPADLLTAEADGALRPDVAHDRLDGRRAAHPVSAEQAHDLALAHAQADRKSTRLNSSHDQISYAVFCLKKKKKTKKKKNEYKE